MDSKVIAAILVVIICIVLFPIAFAVMGGIFGFIGSLMGVVFGLIGGIFGAVFGVIGWIFGSIFDVFGWFFDDHMFGHWPFISSGWNVFTITAVVLLFILLVRSKPSRSRK